MEWMQHAMDAVTVLAADGDGKGGGTDWDQGPQAPPGMGGVLPEWVGWGKWLAIGAGILGLIACGIMMMLGRRNRGHMSAEGAVGALWVIAGLSVCSLAAGVVPAVLA